jgi:hypothetical protein
MKKALLDENLPKQLKSSFSEEVNVVSVPDLGWQAKKNGELLAAMKDNGLRYLITADKNLRFQQNLTKFGVVVVVLNTYDTRRKFIELHVEKIENAIISADSETDVIEVDLRTD